ncbi:AAA family ATPase [Bradyrhizobium sp. CB82]|uniref:AAA family ATPase n=1 Tax=Bradyrhizobium sp. CB82 TaxID=3039159 RepID=UPI0024B12185|nr:AAA family ATPase [Bradyrhizobium sp. CB82]WFU37755.1 AAA family ATPase [Bradyrhizobium sp. CB82]
MSIAIDESQIEVERSPIPWEASQALQSWDRTLANVERPLRAMQFTRAATEVLRLASAEATPQQWQQLVDDLYAMGERHGLPADVVQGLMSAATQAPPDRRSGDSARPLFASVTTQDERPEPPFEENPEYGYGDGQPGDSLLEPNLGGEGTAPVTLITPADWPDEAPPPVSWLADGRIPRGDVTTLHGDGGAGKTDIAMQLAEGCARGAGYWLGHELQAGPVVILSAEEPERELRRRIWLHGRRDSFNPADLVDLHLWFPDDVAGAVFAVPTRSGIMQPTPLFRSIEASIAAIEPVLVIVDNVAATFTGNQNDRVMVRSYVNLWRTIARQDSHPAVLLLDHPSLSGLTNGSGRGGNMDWRNSVRSALYLRVPEDKGEAEGGVRILETQKSNYGPTGQPVRLQWGDGGLALEHAPSSLVRLAEDAKVDDLFLRLLDKRNAQARPVRPGTGRDYAPAEFEGDADAGGIRSKAFKASMERLLNAGTIVVVTKGPPSKATKHIERART